MQLRTLYFCFVFFSFNCYGLVQDADSFRIYNESEENVVSFVDGDRFNVLNNTRCPDNQKDILCIVAANDFSSDVLQLNSENFTFIASLFHQPIVTFVNNSQNIKSFNEIFYYKIGILEKDIAALTFTNYVFDYLIEKVDIPDGLQIRLFSDTTTLARSLATNEVQSAVAYDADLNILLQRKKYQVTEEEFLDKEFRNNKIHWYNRNNLQIRPVDIPIDAVSPEIKNNLVRFYSFHKVFFDKDRSIYTVTIPKILITNVSKQSDAICQLINSFEKHFNTFMVTLFADHTINQPMSYYQWIEYCRDKFPAPQRKKLSAGEENFIYLK